jgi:hypothetical protein
MAGAPWIRFWSVGPDSENSHGLDVHDAPGSIGAQRGYCAMQLFANAGLCGAMDKPGKEPAYSAAFVV